MIISSFYLPLKTPTGQREAHDTIGAICLWGSRTEYMTVFSDHLGQLDLYVADHTFATQKDCALFKLARRSTTLTRDRGGMCAELRGPNAQMVNIGASWYTAHPKLRERLPTTVGIHTALFVQQRLAMSHIVSNRTPQLTIFSSQGAFARFVAERKQDFMAEAKKIDEMSASLSELPLDGPDPFFVQGRIGLVLMDGMRMWYQQQIN